jgi:hypothetical protein
MEEVTGDQLEKGKAQQKRNNHPGQFSLVPWNLHENLYRDSFASYENFL